MATHKRNNLEAIACGFIYDFNFSQRKTHKENFVYGKQQRRILGGKMNRQRSCGSKSSCEDLRCMYFMMERHIRAHKQNA